MRRSPLLIAAAIAVHLLALPAHAQRRGAAEGATFEGWKGVVTLESRDTQLRTVVVPEVGGRVMFYGSGAQNLLWVNPDTAGKTLASAGGAFEPGGFQCDVSPELSAASPYTQLSVGPYSLSRRKEMVVLKSDSDDAAKAELERELMFDPATGELGFVNRVKNTGDRDATYRMAHRIACQPGGLVILPLSNRSRFPKGWSARKEQVPGRGAAYEVQNPSVAAVQVIDGVLVARTGGASTRIGADSDAQWVGYVVGKSLFVVHFPVYMTFTSGPSRDASPLAYPEGGNTVTVDWDERRTELQPFGPETRLRTRKTYEFPMKWMVINLTEEVTTPEAARALVSKVPSSPFL